MRQTAKLADEQVPSYGSKNLAYLLALHSVEGLGPARLKNLVDHFADLKLAWYASEKELKNLGIPQKVLENLRKTKKELEPEKYLEQVLSSGIKILTWFDKDYPPSLKNIYLPPIILYYKGEFKIEDVNAIAVVGTRRITGYGRLVTEKFTSELVAAGLTIVSGLASGVDTTAHRAALLSKGRTLAVLGGGLNKLFPSENAALAEQIYNGRGVVMSEFPPDYPSLPGNFPARNRIVAGLSLGVLVTEAAEDSGSLITARLALEQGKEIFAIPGPITSNLSAGTAQLIKDGAKLVTTTEEILEELGINQMKDASAAQKSEKSELSEVERAILDCLERENKHIDEICRQLQQSSAQVSSSLIKLEILGVVKNLGAGVYAKLAF